MQGGSWAPMVLVGVLAAACTDSGSTEPSPDGGPAAGEGERPPNVLVVTFDTTRADRLGCYGATLGTSPCLDRFAQQAVIFERALAPAPITLPSHSSLFTGLDPILHGVRDNGLFRLDPGFDTLAERLADEGYRTGAFVSAEVLAARFGLAQGFEVYDEPTIGPRSDELRSGERRAHETTAAFAAWLETVGDEPWFAWVHYFDPHQPLTPLPEFAARFTLEYDAEIAAADAAFGTVVDLLERRGLVDRTIWVVTADHGESLGEHREPTHGLGLHDSTQRVPLLVRGPGATPRRVGGQVGLVDLHPTILDWLGLPPEDESCGQSLLGVLRGGPAVRHDLYLETHMSWYGYEAAPLEAISTGDEKLILAPGNGPRAELYDLATDPAELRDRSAADPASVQRLRERMAPLRHDRSPLPGGRMRTLDPAELERLRELGYFQEGVAAGTADPAQAPLPREAQPLIDLLQAGVVALERDDPDQALVALRQVVEQWPQHAVAHGVLGQALRAKGDKAGARAEFERALELRPGLPVPALDLAQLQMEERQPNQALRTLDRLLEHDPANLNALIFAAEIAARKRDYPAALDYLQRSAPLDMNPDQRTELDRRIEQVRRQMESGR